MCGYEEGACIPSYWIRCMSVKLGWVIPMLFCAVLILSEVQIPLLFQLTGKLSAST